MDSPEGPTPSHRNSAEGIVDDVVGVHCDHPAIFPNLGAVNVAGTDWKVKGEVFGQGDRSELVEAVLQVSTALSILVSDNLSGFGREPELSRPTKPSGDVFQCNLGDLVGQHLSGVSQELKLRPLEWFHGQRIKVSVQILNFKKLAKGFMW